MLQRYLNYLKDNPEGYWFKRKLFGWGWTPATWQGWTITILYGAIIIALATTLNENSSPREVAFMLFLPATILTLLFLRIAYQKGEPPRWQWGFPKDHHKKQNHPGNP